MSVIVAIYKPCYNFAIGELNKKKLKDLLYKLIDDKYKIGREVKKEFLDIIETLEDNKFIFEII